MRIVYVYPTLAERGGVERILADKMNMLVELYGYEVFLLTWNQGDHSLSFPLDKRVHHIDLKVRSHVKYQYHGLRRLWEGYRRKRWLERRMQQQLSDIQPDIVVTTTAGELSLLVSMIGDACLVIESHGGFDHLIDYPVKKWRHLQDLRHRYQLISCAHAVIALTERDAERWRKHYPRVHLIPNMVHLNPTDRYSTGENHRVIFVGRLAEQKGIPNLATIWRKVHERHPDWLLDVYGDGDQSALLQDIEGLHLHCSVDDIFPHYFEASLLVVTSLWEPFGLVILEAMSCGLPVVSTMCDGPCSMITDGADGFLADSKELFVERVCQLMEDKNLRKRMGQAAIQTAQRYTAEAIIPQWKELFESLIQ